MRVLKRKDISKYKIGITSLKDPVTNLISTNRVLDHDHSMGNCRQVIDSNVNQFIGKLETNYKRFLGYKEDMAPLPTILRRIADYLEKDYSKNPLHPGWVDLQVRKFSRDTKIMQTAVLKLAGLVPGKTSKDRTKQYKTHVYRKENLYE